MNDNLINKTIEASEQWKTFFNQGNAEGCASMYTEDSRMEAKPFGVYEGREQVEAFWQNIIEQGLTGVNYIEPKIELVDERSTVLTSRWSMNNAEGVITRELWVLQDDGNMRLHEDHFEAIDPNAE